MAGLWWGSGPASSHLFIFGHIASSACSTVVQFYILIHSLFFGVCAGAGLHSYEHVVWRQEDNLQEASAFDFETVFLISLDLVKKARLAGQ